MERSGRLPESRDATSVSRNTRRPESLWVVVAGAAMCAACLPLPGCPSLPPRPASLDRVGVRVGGEWLGSAVFHDDARLGSVTDIKRRVTGELAVVGTGGALFLPPGQGAPRWVAFREPAGLPQLLDRPGGAPRYLDRGGGGWRTGALIGEDGTSVWQPEGGHGVDDVAAGDLDGNGEVEFVAGYNGGGGVRLFDASGRQRWRQEDGNVWHVEIVDTDGDGRAEIVHSNAAGQVTVRDATGQTLSRASTDGYFSEFSVVAWPPGTTSLLHAGDGVTRIIDFRGTVRVALETPDTSSLAEAQGVAVRLGGHEHLVVVVSHSPWDRTQLFVFDEANVMRYREVLAGARVAIAAPDPEAFLLGHGPRVLRYTLRARAGRP
jgi:hypothetical protein